MPIARDENGHFLPGASPNPSGRPKSRKVTEALSKLLDMSPEDRAKFKPTNGYEELAVGLLDSAFKGDGKFGQRAHSQALIYDRIEGKSEPSDKEADAIKGNRTIVLDMPSPALPEETKPEDKDKLRPN
jgi:hypothetical protein